MPFVTFASRMVWPPVASFVCGARWWGGRSAHSIARRCVISVVTAEYLHHAESRGEYNWKYVRRRGELNGGHVAFDSIMWMWMNVWKWHANSDRWSKPFWYQLFLCYLYLLESMFRFICFDKLLDNRVYVCLFIYVKWVGTRNDE